MVGYLHFTAHRGRVRLETHQVLGMNVFEVRLPGREDQRSASKRVQKGLRLLENAGCKRLLAPCSEPSPLPLVHTRALWQTMAPALALADLQSQGLDPRRSVAALCSDRLSRSFLRTCRLLSREVKALSISLDGSDRLEWQLQQELGIPLIQGGGDVTLSFLPGVCRKHYYSLGNADPVIPDCQIMLEGLCLPDGCPTLPLLAALLDSGRLPLSQLYLVPNFP